MSISKRLECVRNGVNSLQVSKIQSLKGEEGVDLCSATSPGLPSSVVNVLDAVGGVQNRVAETLGSTRESLFSHGIDLNLTSWQLGALDEGAIGNSVTISFFPDWNGEPIDQGGFAHELGHVIAGTSSAEQMIHGLRSTSLFNEGFPDMVAYSTYGHVFEHRNDLPLTLDRFFNRNLDIPATFNQPLDFYLETYLYEKGQGICDSLSSAEKNRPHVASVCSYAEHPAIDPIEGYYKTLARAPEPFTAQACESMNAPDWEGMSCDVHQLSLPFTTFLASLPKKNGVSMITRAAQLLAEKSSLRQHHYSCSYVSDASKSHSVEVSLSTFEDLLDVLKPQVNSTIWDEHWKKADLDVGVELEKADIESAAWHFAYAQMKELYDSGTDAFYNASNPCVEVNNSDAMDVPAACKIVCDLKK